MMNPAHCRTCGDQVQHNPKVVGKIATKGPSAGKPLTGWHHRDGMLRDHDAAPHDMRSPEVEAQRIREGETFARYHVQHVLEKNFAELDARDKVNDVFKDRRIELP